MFFQNFNLVGEEGGGGREEGGRREGARASVSILRWNNMLGYALPPLLSLPPPLFTLPTISVYVYTSLTASFLCVGAFDQLHSKSLTT